MNYQRMMILKARVTQDYVKPTKAAESNKTGKKKSF